MHYALLTTVNGDASDHKHSGGPVFGPGTMHFKRKAMGRRRIQGITQQL